MKRRSEMKVRLVKDSSAITYVDMQMEDNETAEIRRISSNINHL